MRAETHNKLGDTHSIECTRLVVRDQFDQPIAVVIEVMPGQYHIHHRGEKTFPRALEVLGIEDTCVTQFIDPSIMQQRPEGGLLLPPEDEDKQGCFEPP